MGRSVSTPSDAVEVFYLDWMLDEDSLNEAVEESIEINDVGELCRHDRETYADMIQADEFDDLVEDLRYVIAEIAPSVSDADRWYGREDRIIAENRLAAFGISEYMGLAAIWVIEQAESDYYGGPDTRGLALHWIGQVWPKIEARYPSRLQHYATFSNGEAVYRRAERTET